MCSSDLKRFQEFLGLLLSNYNIFKVTPEGGVQSQGPEFSDELGGHYGVEC